MPVKDPRPIIGITMGDPVGIGPEIALMALKDPAVYAGCRPFVIGDAGLMSAIKPNLAKDTRLRRMASPTDGRFESGTIDVLNLSDLDLANTVPGKPTLQTGKAMVSYIETAIDLALDGEIHGVATCPINKTALRQTGSRFIGHTEILAHRTETENAVMMLAGARLRVALVTIHEPLKEVPSLLSSEKIMETIHIARRSLETRFGIGTPRLAVAGLNPHAGETGILGREEEELIAPAIAASKAAGSRIEGPFPPDTVFYFAAKGRYDAVICMYHDQGLIPFKLLHFDDGVNTTLGLPIVRTSVDHGTAYDIAGTGTADPRSLIAAIQMAAEQSANDPAITT